MGAKQGSVGRGVEVAEHSLVRIRRPRRVRATVTAVSFVPSGASRRYRWSTAANRSGLSGKSSVRYLRAKTEAGPAIATMR